MRLIILWFQIRSQEAAAQGIQDIIGLVDHESALRGELNIRLLQCIQEIGRLKAEYRRIKRGHGIKSAYQ